VAVRPGRRRGGSTPLAGRRRPAKVESRVLTASDFPRLLAAVRELQRAIVDWKSVRTDWEAAHPGSYPDWLVIGDRTVAVARMLAESPPTFGVPDNRADINPSLPVNTRATISRLWLVVTWQDAHFGDWARSIHALREVRDQLIVFLDDVARLLRPSRFGSCEGPDWDELDPQVRQLLLYMNEHESADLEELCRRVWGKDAADVSEAALDTTKAKANHFLRKRECRQVLSKVRGESCLRWK
jgi:hypothetical protein